MVIQHNLLAANANRQLKINTGKKAKTTEKLSSGYRINRAADDAAGLSISEKMRRQIRGLTQASTNAQDGISMVQVADGAMAEVTEMLQRGNELSVKAANGTLTDVERGYIQDEIEQLKDEINGISDRTKFNEIQVLKGKDVPVQKAPGGAAIINGLPSWVVLGSTGGVLAETYTTTETYTYTTSTGASASGTWQVKHEAATINFSSFDGSADKIAELKGQGFYTTCCTCTNHYSIEFTDGTSSSMRQSGDHYVYSIGIDGAADANELIQRIIAGTENGNPKGHFTILDAVPAGTGTLTVYDGRAKKGSLIDWVPGTGELIDSWPNWKHWNYGTVQVQGDYGRFGRGIAISEKEVVDENPHNVVLQIGGEAGEIMRIDLPSISTTSVGIKDVNVSTQGGAQNAINSFKEAINYVSTERSRMGAYQNRLEHTIKSLDNVVENTQASESRIRDTDMAETMVEYSNLNIIEQTGQAMLAQANQVKQGILSLLG